jgi:hypothetical protein
MDLHHLRCFVAAAEELHFGRAAQRLDMLPSALGRFIRLLEDDLGTRLMTRTTRSVALTDDGAVLLKEARTLLAQADALAGRFRTRGRKRPRSSASAPSTALPRDCCRGSCTISAAPARRHRATGRGQDRAPAAAFAVRPARPRLRASAGAADKRLEFLSSCCTRPPSSRWPTVIRWRRGSA